MKSTNNFLSVGTQFSDVKSAKTVILKVPYEETTSYISGTKDGPEAIIENSAYVELYDEVYRVKPHESGISTQQIEGFSKDHVENLSLIGKEFVKFYKKGKFVVALGGEHSITIGIVDQLSEIEDDFAVIQFDAHADLRSYYQKSHYSHACVMRRVREHVDNTFSLGIRSLSQPEGNLIHKEGIPVIWAQDLAQMTSSDVLTQIFETIKTQKIFITFDVDYFGLDIIRSTGTPEPGGIEWHKTLSILEGLFKKYDVLGMDVVELIGDKDDPASAFNTAVLIKKCITFKHFIK